MAKIHEKLGITIKNYRKLKSYSNLDLAKKLGISVGLVSNLENAKNDVFKLELLNNLLKELDIPLEEIFDICPININNLDFIDNKICLSTNINENIDVLQSINYNSNLIIRNFLNTIYEYECDIETIEYISNHILHGLHTIKLLKNKALL